MGLDSVELVMAVEEHFAIEIPDAIAEELLTVGDLHGFVVHEHHRLARPSVDAHAIFEELRKLICAQIGVTPDRVVPEARFVDDLGID